MPLCIMCHWSSRSAPVSVLAEDIVGRNQSSDDEDEGVGEEDQESSNSDTISDDQPPAKKPRLHAKNSTEVGLED